MTRNPMKPKKPRQKRCPFCKYMYLPNAGLQANCCEKFECRTAYISQHVQKARAKRQKAADKAEREDFKRRKEAAKTRGDWIKETQAAVNALRRHQELAKGRGCMSCGRSQTEVIATDGWKPGGAWDAGHYMSVGTMPAKRFNYRNIWLQCKSCNAGSSKYARKGATVAKQFRENLIALEGLDLVEELERDEGPAKFTIDELKAIKAAAVRDLKQLKDARARLEEVV